MLTDFHGDEAKKSFEKKKSKSQILFWQLAKGINVAQLFGQWMVQTSCSFGDSLIHFQAAAWERSTFSSLLFTYVKILNQQLR